MEGLSLCHVGRQFAARYLADMLKEEEMLRLGASFFGSRLYAAKG